MRALEARQTYDHPLSCWRSRSTCNQRSQEAQEKILHWKGPIPMSVSFLCRCFIAIVWKIFMLAFNVVSSSRWLSFSYLEKKGAKSIALRYGKWVRWRSLLKWKRFSQLDEHEKSSSSSDATGRQSTLLFQSFLSYDFVWQILYSPGGPSISYRRERSILCWGVG